MYRRELGDRYDPADAARLEAVHQLIEQYFDAVTALSARRSPARSTPPASIPTSSAGSPASACTGRRSRAARSITSTSNSAPPRPYFLGVPEDYDRTKPWPLVIKLPDRRCVCHRSAADGDQVASIYTAG